MSRSPEDNVVAINNSNEQEQPRRAGAGLGLRVGGALALSAVVMGGAAGCADGEAAGQTPAPISTPDKTPDTQETQAPNNGEALEVPAGLDPYDVARLIVDDRLTSWENASAQPDLLMTSMNEENKDKSWEQLIDELVEENKTKYADALFVEGWEQDTNLNHYVAGFAEANDSTLTWYVPTQWSEEDPQNKEGYKREKTVQSVEEVDDGNPDDNERTLKVTFVSTSNEALNAAPVAEGDNVEHTYTMTLREENGSEKISAIVVN